MNTYKVFYAKEPTFRENKFRMDVKPFLKYTHTEVCSVQAANLNSVYYMQQAENWSPNGEARELIQSLGLHHTSMSIGDVIQDLTDGTYYEVAQCGFNKLL